MTITEAERKRLARARQKAAQHANIQNPPNDPSYLKTNFAAFVGDRTLSLYENLDAFGAFIAGSTLDDVEQRFPSQVVRDEPLSSLERAIGLVDVMIDAARELADQINAYKLAEIEQAIEAAHEAAVRLQGSSVDAMKAAFAEIEHLKAIRTQLRKPTRHTVAAIRASGE